jgi:hypothetical protein
MTLSESIPASSLSSNTADPRPRLPSDVSHIEITQQPFRFSDLPPELRDKIYAFATEPGVIYDFLGKKCLARFKLTAGLSESSTARALSQVCRSVRKESMEVYYSKKTFWVLSLRSVV